MKNKLKKLTTIFLAAIIMLAGVVINSGGAVDPDEPDIDAIDPIVTVIEE